MVVVVVKCMIGGFGVVLEDRERQLRKTWECFRSELGMTRTFENV